MSENSQEERFEILPDFKDKLPELPSVQIVVNRRTLVSANQLLVDCYLYHEERKVGTLALAVNFSEQLSNNFQTVPLSSGEAVIDSIFIDESFRGKHLGLAVYIKLLELLGFAPLRKGILTHEAVQKIWERLIQMGFARRVGKNTLTRPEDYLDFE